MASLRAFVSSTCFDLGPIRGQLRGFILSMGYEPIMSDYNDVLYDPRIHTHTSCIEEIATCDMVILLVGSRFGGKAIPESLSKVDFDAIMEKSKSVDQLKKKENISVTQLEILKAVELEIPIFTFIEGRLWNDHELYEKNKGKPILNDIEFPSIDKQNTAVFIFEFINFLRHRTKGNSINNFIKFEEIEETLRKQWAGLFQRLLNESRNKILESKRIDILSNQFEDLKTAILTSIRSSNEREVAKGVVRFRRLIDFLKALRISDYSVILDSEINWETFISKTVGIKDIIDISANEGRPDTRMRARTIMVKDDNTFFEFRFGIEYINDMSMEFESFVKMSSENKHIIFDALDESRMGFMPAVRYHREDYYVYADKINQSLFARGGSDDDADS